MILALAAGVALACECGNTVKSADIWVASADRVDVVGVGRVVAAVASWPAEQVTTVRLEEAVKGALGGSMIEIRHLTSGKSCGFQAAVGDPIAVYARERERGLEMTVCDLPAEALAGDQSPASSGAAAKVRDWLAGRVP